MIEFEDHESGCSCCSDPIGEYFSKAAITDHFRSLKVGKDEAALIRVYEAGVLPMYRAVRSWLAEVEEAIWYGIHHQMILGEVPILDSIMDYKRWNPTTDLEKRLVSLHTDKFVEKLDRFIRLEKSTTEPFSEVTASIVDWNCLNMAGEKKLGTSTVKIYGKAMGISGQIAGISGSFDVVNGAAIDYAVENTYNLVGGITSEIRENLRAAIAKGISEGKGMDAVGRSLRDKIGINQRQTVALEAYENRLKASGIGGTKLDGMLQREYNRKLRYRAEMIARTETARAVSEGTLRGYSEAGLNKIQFEAAADACIVCTFYDGNQYTLASGSGLIPVHPNCLISPKSPIVTPDGWTPIGKIEVGDMVLTHKGRFRKVTQLHRTRDQYPEVVSIKTELSELSLTSNHPVLIDGQWIEAGKAAVGNIIRVLVDNSQGIAAFADVEVLEVKIKQTTRKTPTYNISVEEDESYIAKGFVVHNCRCVWVPVPKVDPDIVPAENAQTSAAVNGPDPRWAARNEREAIRQDYNNQFGNLSNVYQPGLTPHNSATTVDGLFADATAVSDDLVALTGDAAAKVDGATTYFGPTGHEQVKSLKSLSRKVYEQFKPIEDVSDAVRSTVVVQRPRDIKSAVQAIKQEVERRGGILVKIEDKIALTNNMGYGGIHADVLMKAPNGHLVRGEIQVHLDSVMKVKEEAHKIYDAFKTIKRIPSQSMERSSKIYNKAFRQKIKSKAVTAEIPKPPAVVNVSTPKPTAVTAPKTVSAPLNPVPEYREAKSLSEAIRLGKDIMSSQNIPYQGKARYTGWVESMVGKVNYTELTVEQANLINKHLIELAHRADRLGIPRLRRLTKISRKEGVLMNMGDGVLGVKPSAMEQMRGLVHIPKTPAELIEATEHRLINTQKVAKVYEDAVAQLTSKANKSAAELRNLKSFKNSLKKTQKEIDNMQANLKAFRQIKPGEQVNIGQASSDWLPKKKPLNERPLSASEYFETYEEKIINAMDHEFGHHIQDQMGVTNNALYKRPPVETTVKRTVPVRANGNKVKNQTSQGWMSPTRYGDTSPSEAFAENYSLWVAEKDHLVSPFFKRLFEELSIPMGG